MAKPQPNPFEQAIADEFESRRHEVLIWTRYGETTRDCYCTATKGRDHHESESPWIHEAAL